MKHQVLKSLFSDDWYQEIKFSEISGRYLINEDLEILKEGLDKSFEINKIGKSVEGKLIYRFKTGKGTIKILAWSQMHGNESTTTKAVFDLFNAFVKNGENQVLSQILQNCSLYFIPILNPDGAEAYTRVNANSVDLNRDLQELGQPESRILREEYDRIKPDFCLNLHDQRTIFSAGSEKKPATLSFLTPSRDKERSIDLERKKSMGIIAGIAADLQSQLPGQIGRYDDAFNLNCAGDTFQNLSTPTILFEAGHYPGDYEREQTRKYGFRALLSCLYQIATGEDASGNFQSYFDIPENGKLFNDVVIRNVLLKNEIKDIAIQYKEILSENKIHFEPVIEKIASNIPNYGHYEIDAQNEPVKIPGKSEIIENVVVNKIILKYTELELKP